MKRLTLTLLSAAWLSAAWLTAAHAQQIYDLDIVMKNVAIFAGTFVYNASRTGECSAVFCGSGVTPEFSNVFIKDPLSIDGPNTLSFDLLAALGSQHIGITGAGVTGARL